MTIEVSLPVYITLWIVVTVVVLSTIIGVTRLLRRAGKQGLEREFLQERKKGIEKLLQGTTDSEWRLAIIEADSLLDHLLKARRFAGNTLGERLKVASYKHKAIRAAWEPHKVRNAIVHEPNTTLTQNEAERLWKIYKAAYEALLR